jgi:hypothetical protein
VNPFPKSWVRKFGFASEGSRNNGGALSSEMEKVQLSFPNLFRSEAEGKSSYLQAG